MALRRKGSATQSPAAAAYVDTPEKRKKRGTTSILRRISSAIALSVVALVVIGGCTYFGYRMGEHIADNYIEVTPEKQKVVVEEEEDAEYAQLLKYPPLKERRGIRRINP